jgi:hypothetical protein
LHGKDSGIGGGENMANIRIIGKKGSQAVKDIIEGTGILRYRGNKGKKVDLIINYGLTRDRLGGFFRLYPSARGVPILNKGIGRAKLSAIQDAERIGIKVPKSRLHLPAKVDPKKWIEKRQNSIGGKGIKYASRKRPRIQGKYFQEFISNRKYELRVHAFKWIDDSNWVVQKRIGDQSEIAWNFHNGGVFHTVRNSNAYKVFSEAKEISKKILELRHMSFGAVDFIVDKEHNTYFIEINSAPGFQELSKHIYVDAFNKLKLMKGSEINKL